MLVAVFIVVGVILTAICIVAYTSKKYPDGQTRSSAVSDALRSELAHRHASGHTR
ncbi:MAG: hypothetical protein JSS95_03060 [Acidobacteria bacterium]|nr:hypothetical protein [Acidobacteriota bacterium]